MELPSFRYHPDPLASGSIVRSEATCRCCGQARGYIYQGPVYAEADLDAALCPWCIGDGSAQRRLGATFVDVEAFPDDVPAASIAEITERTPGYDSWQGEVWPACCGDACAFLGPAGIAEIRRDHRELEGTVMSHIVYDMGISGGAARRLLEALDRDAGPTAVLFRCLACGQVQIRIDQP